MERDVLEEVAGSLQARIGQLVSQYETDMALLRAKYNKQLKEKDDQIQFLIQEKESHDNQERTNTDL